MQMKIYSISMKIGIIGIVPIIINIELNNINIDNNFDENDPDTIILIKLLAWHIKFEKHKALKKCQ